MKPINVLSIDFDYFVKATAEQRMTIFPDGLEQFGVSVNNAVWCSRYGDCADLEEIGIIEDDYTSMVNYLNMLKRKPQASASAIVVTNSHRWLYDVLSECFYEHPVNIFHIDFHTDRYGLKDKPDCGNWVDWLAHSWRDYSERLYKMSKVTWLGREDSEEVESDRFFKAIKRNDQSLGDQIDNYFGGRVPDLIFICKSGPWTPPHLDDHFDELISIAHMFRFERGTHTQFSSDVENRWTDEYREGVASYKKQISELLRGNDLLAEIAAHHVGGDEDEV